MKRTAGYSLIEMCVVIACLSVVVTIACGVIHGLLRVNDRARRGLVEQATMARLAETFRADVHAADALTAATGKPARLEEWELKRAGAAAATYRVEGGSLVRTAKTPAGTARDSFALPKGASVTIQEHAEGEARLAVLSIAAGEVDQKKPTRGLRVEAQLGRDRRLAETPTQASKTEATGEKAEEPSDE